MKNVALQPYQADVLHNLLYPRAMTDEVAPIEFQVRDIVSRDGTDVQKIMEINEAGDLILVECVKEPLGFLNDDGTRDPPWCRIGEQEWNLARRYTFAGPEIDIRQESPRRKGADKSSGSRKIFAKVLK